MPDARRETPAARDRIAAVRRFNRFYTRQIGALDEGHLHSPFSLAAVRVLYALAHWDDPGGAPPTPTDVGCQLGLDAGYLSRLLSDLARRRLIKRTASPADGRQHHLRLTRAGRATFARLDARAGDEVALLLAPLDEAEQQRLVDALQAVETVLSVRGAGRATDPGPRAAVPYLLRLPYPGDLGWVVARHGALYAREYGWDERFEGVVARIVADFVEHHEPRRERCWIAEREGENIGSVFLVRHPERTGVAKLRLLLVEPSARGLGIGRRLVDECTRFARQAGYHTITLWTNSVLVAARRIYAAAGYQRLQEERHHSFGHDLVAETWELAL